MADDVVYDESPTANGKDWFCNACLFRTADKEQAIAHALKMRDESPFIHMLYERSHPESPPSRRIAPESTGVINTVRVTARAKPKKKK